MMTTGKFDATMPRYVRTPIGGSVNDDGSWTFVVNLKEKENAMLSWDEATKAMENDGFGWAIERRHNIRDVSLGYRAIGKVESDFHDPVLAINDLLTKCRERWPAKHPYDDKSLEELINICYENEWMWRLSKSSHDEGYNAFIIEASPTIYHEVAAEALRSAMKVAEKGRV